MAARSKRWSHAETLFLIMSLEELGIMTRADGLGGNIKMHAYINDIKDIRKLCRYGYSLYTAHRSGKKQRCFNEWDVNMHKEIEPDEVLTCKAG